MFAKYFSSRMNCVKHTQTNLFDAKKRIPYSDLWRRKNRMINCHFIIFWSYFSRHKNSLIKMTVIKNRRICVFAVHELYYVLGVRELWSVFQQNSFAVLILWNKCSKSELMAFGAAIFFRKIQNVYGQCISSATSISDWQSLKYRFRYCVLLRMPINVFNSISPDCSAMLIWICDVSLFS